MDEKQWLHISVAGQILAVQHGCGASDAPVNCYLDEHHNWVCPNCLTTYGAAVPLDGWNTNSKPAEGVATTKVYE